jgi:hypothetical protein
VFRLSFAAPSKSAAVDQPNVQKPFIGYHRPVANLAIAARSSFGLIRAGHVDVTVLGCDGSMQRDISQNWREWGAMDPASGAQRVLQYAAKGKSKIVQDAKPALGVIAAGRRRLL